MKKLAILGTGAMGFRIAINLINAGYELAVWNRTPGRYHRLIELGAVSCTTPRVACEKADVIIAMLTDDAASREVWLGVDTGGIVGIQPGKVVLEYSTLTPSWCKELAAQLQERGVDFLDAPVVGSRPQAEGKQLIHLVGGDAKVLNAVSDILNVCATAVHHVGPVGSGMTVKLAVNGLFAIQVAALSESLGVLEKAGISVKQSLELLSGLPTTSLALKGVGGLIETRNYAPLFPISLVEKDLNYLARLADANGAITPVVDAARKVFCVARENGYADDNISAISQLYL